MEEIFTPEKVKNRLILAGLKELDKHGVIDFSLRRVAIEAGVSCAAPYRHFKDKDELISAILAYVMEGWTLLSEQIGELYSDDPKSLIGELAVAGVRFWIANGNFRTVIMNAPKLSDGGAMRAFESPFLGAVEALCTSAEDSDKTVLTFKVLSLVYGAITLADAGYESADAADHLRSAMTDLLQNR